MPNISGDMPLWLSQVLTDVRDGTKDVKDSLRDLSGKVNSLEKTVNGNRTRLDIMEAKIKIWWISTIVVVTIIQGLIQYGATLFKFIEAIGGVK